MIIDRCRDIEEFKAVHKSLDNGHIATPEGILANWDYHFCFYRDNGDFVGCIYLEDDEGKVCISGFAKPKNYDIVIEAINWVSEFMRKDDLYSNTVFPSAKLVLRRCGFKKIDDDTYFRKAF